MVTESIRKSIIINKSIFLMNNNVISYNQYFYMFYYYNIKDVANELTRITFELFSKEKIKELLCTQFNRSGEKEKWLYLPTCTER